MLNSEPLVAFVPATDLDRARGFYARPDPADTPLDPANSDLAAGANPEAADPESAARYSAEPGQHAQR